MLLHLSISNYALIDKLEINFRDGLTIITGETGAGKSILLGALSLILGKRADSLVLNDKSEKCVVEGTFHIKDYGLKNFFSLHELDYEDDTVIRREISQNGKSRSFINDTPVTLDLLKDLGEQLIDIHSQHKTLTLQDAKFQLAYIDSYTQHDDIIHQFQDEFNKYNQFKSELALLLEKEKQSKADEDYYRFQFEELNTANLKEDNEQEELENELSLLTHAEEIKSNLANVLAVLNAGEQNMTGGLKELSITLSKIASLHPAMEELSKRLESCCIELKDIAQEIDFAEQKIVFNSLRLEEVNERLNIIYHLQKKHRVQTINELRKIKEDISIKLGFINNLDNQINDLQKSCITSENKLKEISTILTKNRKKAIAKIEKGVLDVLKNLAIPNAEFQIAHSLLDEYNNWGNDKVVFLFNANKGGALNEIAKVASGGELARLMLSIKSLISEKKLLPTIIFDEIDQGVSGEIADKVGNIMKKMSETMQVVTITHLPQIASKGNAHLMVYKEINQNTTFTRIKNLNQEERVEEIAKMLSGNELSKAAVENAKVLLKNKN